MRYISNPNSTLHSQKVPPGRLLSEHDDDTNSPFTTRNRNCHEKPLKNMNHYVAKQKPIFHHLKSLFTIRIMETSKKETPSINTNNTPPDTQNENPNCNFNQLIIIQKIPSLCLE